MKEENTLRECLYRQLESPSSEGLTVLRAVVIAVIVASVALCVAGSEPVVQESLGKALPLTELVVGVVFAIELLARLWSVGLDHRYAGVRGTVRYLLKPLTLVDILVIISLFAPAISMDLAVLRLLRIVRIVTLAKFGRYSQALAVLGEAISLRKYELGTGIAVAALVVLISATGMYTLEGEIQPEAFGSIPRALWWSIATMTTVGYGDVYPITGLGRFFAGVTAVAGIGLIAMPTGVLAAAFSEISARRKKEGKE